MNFEPVTTLEELDALNEADMLEGYMSAERGDPEPGPNRGKAFWHGWRNRMMDMHELPVDAAAMTLVNAVVERTRVQRQTQGPTTNV